MKRNPATNAIGAARFNLANARASRAGDGALALADFFGSEHSDEAPQWARVDACAPQKKHGDAVLNTYPPSWCFTVFNQQPDIKHENENYNPICR